MYDIGIPEISITKRYESTDGRSIKYDAEAAVRPSVCTNPDCGHEIKPHIHSRKNNLIRDIKAEGKIVLINLSIKRYRCPDCGYVFPDEFTFYDKNAHFTNRLKQEFVDRCIKGETFNYIARDYSVDHKTVAAAFKAYTAENQELFINDYTPSVLGIDEAHIDDHFRLVLTDIVKQRLLDIKKDNKASTVKTYLRSLDKDTCKAVTMDFAPAYSKCVRQVLPDATIVIDKFHVIQEINRCLDRVRIDIQNRYRDQGVNIRRFKNAKYLFMANFEDLSSDGLARLQGWFDEFPELYEAYMTKETFRDIYSSAKSWGEASSLFNAWLKTIPDYPRFEPMRKTMSKRREHILNYFKVKWTNAYTESVNNQIKKIEKAGRGYKFATLRERCLLEINTPKPDKFDPKAAEFVDVETGEIFPSLYEEQQQKVENLYIAIPEAPKFDIPVDIRLDIANVGLHEALDVYLECFDQTKRISMDLRLAAYAEKLKALRISQDAGNRFHLSPNGDALQNF